MTSTAAKRVEQRIARKLLQRREMAAEQQHISFWADRLIAIAAVTVSLFIVGSFIEELLWLAVAVATVFTLK
ncbi:MAG: hypothetical protein P8L39_16195 [Halioglobus sp.]|nr:hypothetical protein [Halioglobus sp.]